MQQISVGGVLINILREEEARVLLNLGNAVEKGDLILPAEMYSDEFVNGNYERTSCNDLGEFFASNISCDRLRRNNPVH